MITPDLRGFGENAYCESPFSLTALADDINGLMSYLGIGRAVMVGVSMAGALLLDLLERYPQRVAAACFLSPVMRPVDASEQVRRFDLAELVREGHCATAIENLCERLLSGQPSPAKQVLANQLRSWMRMPSPATLAGSLEANPVRLCFRDESQFYPVPALIITGSRDKVMPMPIPSGPASGVRHVVKGAGYLVKLEAPAEVNRLLLCFLQNLNAIKLHHHRSQKVA